MGRAPCCDKEGVTKGSWKPEEDQKLVDYIKRNGHRSWSTLPKRAGLLRCGKSCRLRWINYLRPDIKRGKFSYEEEQTIIQLHGILGNKWSAIAARLPGRTDNEIKNFWNSRLRKRLLQMGIDPVTHLPKIDLSNFANINHFLGSAGLTCMTPEWGNARLQETMMAQQLQEPRPPNQNTGPINTVDIWMRSQLESSFTRPDFTTDYILSQILAQNPQSQLGSLEYNTLITWALEQSQSQSQIMNNLQHLSPISTLDSFSTQLQQQDKNSKPSHSEPIINSQASVTPDQNFNPYDSYDNLLNALTLISQQQPCSKSCDVNSSLALDNWIMLSEKHLFEFSKSDVESNLPGLRSSTSSPVEFSDPDLVPESSSSMVSMNANAGSTFTATCDESYGVPLEFLLNSQEVSEQREKFAMENVEDERVYWSNVLGSLEESL